LKKYLQDPLDLFTRRLADCSFARSYVYHAIVLSCKNTSCTVTLSDVPYKVPRDYRIPAISACDCN